MSEMQPPFVYNDGSETASALGMPENPQELVNYNYDLSNCSYTSSQPSVPQPFYAPPIPATPVPVMPQYPNWNYYNATPYPSFSIQNSFYPYNSYFNQPCFSPTSQYWNSMTSNVPTMPMKTQPKNPKFSEWQRRELEKRYQKDPFCKQPERNDLAASVGLTQYQVKIWFQNKRAKDKKKPVVSISEIKEENKK